MVNPLDLFNPCFADKVAKQKEKRAESRDIQRLAEKFILDKSDRNFSALMKRCSIGLRAFIYSMTNNWEDVDNIMSLTMERIYFKIDSFNGDLAKFSTWMYKIAHNVTVTYFRSGGLKSKVDTVSIDFSEIQERMLLSDDDSSIFSELDAEIENMSFDGEDYTTYTKSKIVSDIYDASIECLNNLPEKLRVVLFERYINKKKINKIAEDNNLSKSSVKNWIRKGCVEIANEIQKKHKDLYDIFNEIKNG